MESIVKRSDKKAVHATKYELSRFLQLLETNPRIQMFLRHDRFFRLADKYLIAMVFIYFKRAQLNLRDYTYLNFFAGLCLAHSMEEDFEMTSEIYPWALGNEINKKLPKFLKIKLFLWEAMNYRAAVSSHCCNQLILIFQNHSVWKRERLLNCETYRISTKLNCAHCFLNRNSEKSNVCCLVKSCCKWNEKNCLVPA